MEILLIRHGLPNREEKTDASLADPSLAPIGQTQAERLANWLVDDKTLGSTPKINHIAVSPRLRAVQTAEPLAKKLNIEPEVVNAFAEIDRSSSLYIPIEEMRREEHPQWKKLVNQQWEDAGFMDPEKFQKEVLEGFWDLIDRRDASEKVAIVCHGGTINAIAAALLELNEFFFFEPAYTSITRLRTGFRGKGTDSKKPEHFRVVTMNESAHFHAEAGTLEALPKL